MTIPKCICGMPSGLNRDNCERCKFYWDLTMMVDFAQRGEIPPDEMIDECREHLGMGPREPEGGDDA